MKYAKIKNNEVSSLGFLPKKMKTDTNWILGFDKLQNFELKNYGYLPIEENSCDIDKSIEKRGADTITIEADRVVITWTKVAKSYEEQLDYCRQMRKSEYPPFEDYLDAKVKQSCFDSNVVEEGLIQEEEYYQACLAVKAKYPKPSQ
jgi:hypothetical protein